MIDKMKINKTELERLMFIEALLLMNGKISRNELIERFGLSTKTVSRLFKSYSGHCPGQMILDNKPRKPVYVKTDSLKPCLFTSLKSAKMYLEVSFSLNTFF